MLEEVNIIGVECMMKSNPHRPTENSLVIVAPHLAAGFSCDDVCIELPRDEPRLQCSGDFIMQ